jgi:transcriptional regulator with XRE-family HTH domain
MESLGEQIREVRIRRDMSQEDLAIRVGASRASINMYENGKGNPEFRVIAALAAALKTTFNVLGCAIGPDDVERPALVTEQLSLDFDRDHTFLARLVIRPSGKSVLITAEARLSDKLA